MKAIEITMSLRGQKNRTTSFLLNISTPVSFYFANMNFNPHWLHAAHFTTSKGIILN